MGDGGADDRLGRGGLAERDPALAEERGQFLRLLRLGRVVWPAFFGVDLLLVFFVFHAAPLWPFALLRLAGQALIEVAGLLARLDRPWVLGAANVGLSTAVSTFIAVMALHLGGPSSPYMHGISIVILVQSIVLPAPLSRGLRKTVPAALSFPLVMLAAAPFEPAIARALTTPSSVSLAVAHYVFVLSSAAVGSVASHSLWTTRRQIFEARKLGRYRLEARIGEGGMNEVWLARDEALRRPVALKVLRTGGATDARTIARFEREARAMSALASPNTVRVYDFGASDDGLSYIAMEYVDGLDLARLVRATGPLPATRAVHVGVQLCRSLAEAHGAGIVHRDVKPANVMVTRTGDAHDLVKVLDFGIARVMEGTESTHTTMAGTPAYMAPEVWCGDPVDARSDIYSIGATLYFLLAGSPPFESGDRASLLGAHMQASPEAIERRRGEAIPAALEAAVLRCLAKRPADRFASARELADALAAAVPEAWTAEDARAAWARADASPKGA